MIPVITIVGRPNVGKSTLFNRLTKTRRALVADQPGLTRDRQYGAAQIGQLNCIIIDTGGLGEISSEVDKLMSAQALQAVAEASVVLFVVDARAGITAGDRELVQQLRMSGKTVLLVVNKCDGLESAVVAAEFYELGFKDLFPVSAEHGIGFSQLERHLSSFLKTEDDGAVEPPQGIKVAFIGQPNVGKSTLVNRILGEERVIVFDQPGTTRDTIYVPFQRRGEDYILIDTAGIRRRARVENVVEKFSVIKALQAIDETDVVVLIIDARKGIVEQDLRLLGFIIDAGRALIIAINKWDNMPQSERERVRSELDRRLGFIDYAAIHYISALHGTGVGNIFTSIKKAYRSAHKELATPELTRILEYALQRHEPPLVKGRRIKLRYAHAGGHAPPRIIIHGKQANSIPESYRKYLEKIFREQLKLYGTPVKIELRTDANPYA